MEHFQTRENKILLESRDLLAPNFTTSFFFSFSKKGVRNWERDLTNRQLSIFDSKSRKPSESFGGAHKVTNIDTARQISVNQYH